MMRYYRLLLLVFWLMLAGIIGTVAYYYDLRFFLYSSPGFGVMVLMIVLSVLLLDSFIPYDRD